MSKKRIKAADLRGITRLLTDATIGVTDLVEAMHRRIVHPPFLPSTPIQHLITGISGFTFKNVKLVTKLVGSGLDKSLGYLPDAGISLENKGDLLAALNGVVGDHLENTHNPLAIPMNFKYQGTTISTDAAELKKTVPAINGKILLLVHGLCMNDTQWCRNGHDHGQALAKELGLTPIYLHYNSGRHISTNGQLLNAMLEQLVRHWPVPVDEIVMVTHSMGGLVSRSAVHYGKQAKLTWTKRLKKIIFLGTPHHGAPLERAGNYIDLILEATPYAKPFARLGKIRSAGITDLRHGNLLDEDWEGMDRFESPRDQRMPVPLPDGTVCYSIAATTGKEGSDRPVRIAGDGLVSVKSALGQHKEADKNLHFKSSHTSIVYENNHMDLLDCREVYEQMMGWLLE